MREQLVDPALLMATKDAVSVAVSKPRIGRTWFAIPNQCHGRGAVLCSRVAPVGEGRLLVRAIGWMVP